LGRLSTDLGDIPHKITPLLWSGANSVFVRDKTAQRLAEHLSVEHAEHPQAIQLVIAHSHGGNIALGALHHLHQRDASQVGGADTANPLVVTLATPFVEVHPADFGRRPFWIRVTLILVPFPAAILFFPHLFEHFDSILAGTALVLVLVSVVMGWWFVRRAPVRRKKLDALKNATRLGELVSADRLLVIRAIDDEAALTLALGAILNYVTARTIPLALVLFFALPLLFALLVMVLPLISWLTLFGTLINASGLMPYLIFMLLLTLMVSRAVHGRELAVSPMECQINTQSTPEGVGAKIVTLVRRTYAKSLRHGIYDHEDCAKTISDWVRSQLCT
jgi:hypothetical protein